MKKLFSMLLVCVLVATMLSGVTVFAEALPVTVDSVDGSWANATWDAATSILTNVDGGYAFKATISSGKATLSAASATLITAASVTVPTSFTVGETTYPVVAVNGYLLTGGLTPAVTTTDVKTVVLPEGLTTINANAFRSLTGLSTINLPSTLTSIGGYAFAGAGLTSVTIPGTVTTFGTYVFSGCASLLEITFEEGIATIPDRTCNSCSALTTVNIPSTVTTIKAYSFYNCKFIESFGAEISEDVWDLSHVTSMGQEAIYVNNTGWTGELILGISSITKQMIRGTGLDKITFVNPVTSINADNVFYTMANLRTLVFEQGPAPTAIKSTWSAKLTPALTIIYPDDQMDSFKAANFGTTKIAAVMSFGGYIGSVVAGAEGGYDVTYAVANYKAKNVDKAIIALFNGDDMVGAKVVDATVGTTLTTVNVPVTGTVTSAKIFLLDGFGNLKPAYVNDTYTVADIG
ncbi:MAG: leucine-rich repeat domain-containing protein [Eubacteriales bacterium]|nr:leucine-rich repeat domain-containing protein [Eubacteriales bacterium]